MSHETSHRLSSCQQLEYSQPTEQSSTPGVSRSHAHCIRFNLVQMASAAVTCGIRGGKYARATC